MRLLHVHSGNLYGGVEALLSTAARCRALCAEMHPEFALCFDGRIAAELRQTGATVHILGHVRARNPLQVISARRRLIQILSAGTFDAVICHMAWPLAVFGPAVRRVKLPLIFWMHDAVTSRNWLVLWARIDTPSEAVVIIQASRMEPWKGHRTLLEALARLTVVPQWVCWIAGGPQRPEEAVYEKALRALATDLGLMERIRFLGWRSDVDQLLLAADIYCQANLGAEPFGIAFIEAMQAGLPVVTTSAGGPLEILDESCGILVHPNDAVSLAAALQSLLTDKSRRRRLGGAGVQRAAQLCDPGRQLRQLHNIIQRAANPGLIVRATA